MAKAAPPFDVLRDDLREVVSHLFSSWQPPHCLATLKALGANPPRLLLIDHLG